MSDVFISYKREDRARVETLYALLLDLDVPVMATELPMAGFDSYAIWITERATDGSAASCSTP